MAHGQGMGTWASVSRDLADHLLIVGPSHDDPARKTHPSGVGVAAVDRAYPAPHRRACTMGA